mgnify:CR=1 FL=1
MWQKEEAKLELAASMVRQVMPALSSIKNVIIRCYICHYFPATKDICNDAARSYIIAANFFIGQHKIFPNGESAPACCWPALFSCTLLRQIIYNRIRPCTAYILWISLYQISSFNINISRLYNFLKKNNAFVY